MDEGLKKTSKGLLDSSQKVKMDVRSKSLASQDEIDKNKWMVRAGIKRMVVRPPEEYDIQLREDRIGRYLKKYLSKFIFAEFSDEYMKKGGMTELMKGVPIPLRREDLASFAGGNGIKPTTLAANMAWIMGIDPHFQYTPHYVKFLLKIFNWKISEGMLKTGRDAAERQEFDEACIHFRATLCMNPEYLHGMYSYARVLREMYMQSDNPEYVGRFKAEALDFFELTTEAHPRHAQSYYYLGYAYLNMGLYTKAKIAWQRFNSFTRNAKDRREISKRLKQIEEPVKIENAINKVCQGNLGENLTLLEHHQTTEYGNWWPLYYYLGIAYKSQGRRKDALNSFRRVLDLNPSHLGTMEELRELYEDMKDKELSEKYRKKIEVIKKALEEENAALSKKVKKERPTEDRIKMAKPIEEKKKTIIKRLKP
ncbi:MAG: tetratricopeptide repeat protein [Clostridiales bacterium]|nr:tetratricopeptide repeat protein [Clostridiales bacterium]